MSGPSDRTSELRSLFEAVTGQSTVTETQRTDRAVRVADETGATRIEGYVGDAVRDDAVPEPEPR